MTKVTPELIAKISSQLNQDNNEAGAVKMSPEQIQHELSNKFKVQVDLEDGTKQEYVSSDKLTLRFDQNNQKFEFHIHFSWIEPYVLLDWRIEAEPRTWELVEKTDLPLFLKDVYQQVTELLEQNNYQILEGNLNEIIPDHQSKMDDSPLIIREALFYGID